MYLCVYIGERLGVSKSARPGSSRDAPPTGASVCAILRGGWASSGLNQGREGRGDELQGGHFWR